MSRASSWAEKRMPPTEMRLRRWLGASAAPSPPVFRTRSMAPCRPIWTPTSDEPGQRIMGDQLGDNREVRPQTTMDAYGLFEQLSMVSDALSAPMIIRSGRSGPLTDNYVMVGGAATTIAVSLDPGTSRTWSPAWAAPAK